MRIHGKKRLRYQIQTPLTPLIDIVFMLLVFFLLTTNFIAEQGIDVNLPRAEASSPQTRQEITVYIDPAGRVYLGENEIDFNDLFGQLKRRIEDNPGKSVVIRADRSIQLDRAVQVMDIARAAGAGRLFLATERKNQ